MSDPRGWDKHKDAIESAKKELLQELGLLGDKETLDHVKDTVNGLKTNLAGTLNANVVKSIQKQTKAGMGTNFTFTIAEVDPDKCFVYVNGSGGTGDDGFVVTYNGMTATTVSVYCHASQNTNVAIEVIEFY